MGEKSKPFTMAEDAELTRLYCEEHLSVADIAATLGRRLNNVANRVKSLHLLRTEGFMAKWNERREAARARMAEMSRNRSDLPGENRTEEHAAKCISKGGFPAFGEAYVKGGHGPSSISPSRDWRLLPIGQVTRAA